MKALQDLTEQLLLRYHKAKVKGHRDFNKNKSCPCFDAEKWWNNLQKNDTGVFEEYLQDENKFNPKR